VPHHADGWARVNVILTSALDGSKLLVCFTLVPLYLRGKTTLPVFKRLSGLQNRSKLRGKEKNSAGLGIEESRPAFSIVIILTGLSRLRGGRFVFFYIRHLFQCWQHHAGGKLKLPLHFDMSS
jgi:hypothetical protein